MYRPTVGDKTVTLDKRPEVAMGVEVAVATGVAVCAGVTVGDVVALAIVKRRSSKA